MWTRKSRMGRSKARTTASATARPARSISAADGMPNSLVALASIALISLPVTTLMQRPPPLENALALTPPTCDPSISRRSWLGEQTRSGMNSTGSTELPGDHAGNLVDNLFHVLLGLALPHDADHGLGTRRPYQDAAASLEALLPFSHGLLDRAAFL